MVRIAARIRSARGATLIEVLVTIVIIAFGLLGMAGLQTRMQISEIEAYQRSQALMLVNDMASRITTNRQFVTSYVTSDTLGTGFTCTGLGTTTQALNDLREWCLALQGAGETLTTGSVTTQQGAMIGGRGCIENSPAGDGDIMVTVTWQGLTPISAPPASVTCGADSYNGTGSSPCVDNKCRRFITMILRIATLGA